MTTTPINHWKLGLFVVVGVIVGLCSIVYLGAASLRRDHVTYTSYFDESVAGLDVGAPIYFRGVKVGQVSDIGLGPDHRHVAVSCALFTGDLRDLGLAEGGAEGTHIDVSPDLRVQLVSEGLTGLKGLQIDFVDSRTSPPPELPFDPPPRYIPATVSTLKALEDQVSHAVDRVPDVADALLRVAAHADHILDQVDRARLPDAAATTLADLDRVLVSARATLDRGDLAKLSRQAQAGLTDLDATIHHVDAILGKVDGKGGLLANAQRTTTAFGDVAAGAPALGDELLQTLREIQEAATSFRRLSDAIERDPTMLLKGRGRDE